MVRCKKADSPATLHQSAEHPRKTDFSLFERQGELRSKRKYPGVKNRARAESEMQRQFFWEVAIPLQRVAVAGRLPIPISNFQFWRRGRDSNPRGVLSPATLAVLWF